MFKSEVELRASSSDLRQVFLCVSVFAEGGLFVNFLFVSFNFTVYNNVWELKNILIKKMTSDFAIAFHFFKSHFNCPSAPLIQGSVLIIREVLLHR